MNTDEKNAVDVFTEAVALSRDGAMLTLSSIAFYQKKSKKYYYEWAEKIPECKEMFDLIQTNCEALTFQAMKLGKLDIKQGLFMLEKEFGMTENQAPVTIKFEGMKDEEVEQMLKEM